MVTDKQVSGVAARGIVARMQDVLADWNRTFKQLVGKAVSTQKNLFFAALPRQLSVFVSTGTLPFPTLRWISDIGASRQELLPVPFLSHDQILSG
jgi:hypothetical protein